MVFNMAYNVVDEWQQQGFLLPEGGRTGAA